MLKVFALLAVFFVIAEQCFPARSRPILRRGLFADLLYVPIHFFMRTFINGTVLLSVADLARRFLPGWSIGVLEGRPVWLQALVILLVLDFLFYVMHRLKHRWHWWWRLHETHHSSVDLDWLSTARFHPLEKALDRTIFLLPLVFLGVSDTAMVIWAAVDAGFGMFIHSNLKWRIGPLIYVFAGPEMHHWHHALDPERRECNYGNNLSIFDWIFGTAYHPLERPVSFGVDDPAYPVGDVFKQFFYAFRPADRAPDGGSSLSARSETS